jgi:hypothetical protein
MMELRILKTQRGFIVERKKFRWSLFGLKYKWVPFIETSGIKECWNHQTYEFAIMNIQDKIKNDLFIQYNLKDKCSHYFAMKSNGQYMKCEFCNINKNEL